MRRNSIPSSVSRLFGMAGVLVVLAGMSARAENGEADSGAPLPAQDSAIVIPVPTLASGDRTDHQIFADICGCLSGRVKIRRDAPDFVPVGWKVRTMDGRVVVPRDEQRGSAAVVLDLTDIEPGIYLVSLRDQSGKVITRPLNVR